MPVDGIFEKVNIQENIPCFVIRHTRSGSEIVKSHWHPELEFNVAFEGSSRFFINGRVEDMNPQHVVLINSREIHSSIPHFSTEGFAITGVTLQISYPFLKSLLPNYDDCYFTLTENSDKKIHALVSQLNSWYEQEDIPFLSVLVVQQICQIVYILLTECLQTKKPQGNDSSEKMFQKLEAVLSYIHDHYKQPLYTSQIAERFYFSKEYFCRFFKKYTGVTFHQYLIRYRVLQAEQLLSNNSLTISQIAQETGFADESSFIQYFRKYFNCTPGKYRKQITKTLYDRVD